jgi:drug/metabolite transporter (DMT)-like permease
MRLWSALLALYFVWGSTFIAIRVAVETIPPFLMAGVRFAIAGLLVVGWMALRDGHLPRVTRRQLRDSTIVGGLLLGGGNGLVAWGEQTVNSGTAAVLIALMPAWLAVFSRTLLGDRLPRMVVLGIAIGFVGVAVLVAPTDTGGIDLAGAVALLLSPVTWALGSLYAARRADLPDNGFLAIGVQMLAGSVVLGVMALVTGELVGFNPAAISSDSGLGLAYLVFIGSLIGYRSYGYLLRHAPLPLVSTYAYVNPVVAVGLGALLLGEAPGPRILLGSVVIIVGVALIVTARSRSGPTPAADPVPEPVPSTQAIAAPGAGRTG